MLSSVLILLDSVVLLYIFRAGSLKASARELARYKLDVVGVQEVRWDKGGTERAGDYDFFYGKGNDALSMWRVWVRRGGCIGSWWGNRREGGPLGRPRRRWVDNIRMDLQKVGCGYMDWIGLAQDRDRWRTLVSAVKNLRVP